MGEPIKFKSCQYTSQFNQKQYGCGTSIGWDEEDECWREEGTNKIHTKERCKEVRASKQQSQPQQQTLTYNVVEKKQGEAKATDRVMPPMPEGEVVQQPKKEEKLDDVKINSTPPNIEEIRKFIPEMNKTIGFMWTMIKGINEKLDTLKTVKNDQANLIDGIAKWKTKQDEFITEVYAHLVPVEDQIKPTSRKLGGVSAGLQPPKSEAYPEGKTVDGPSSEPVKEFNQMVKMQHGEIEDEDQGMPPPEEEEADSEDNNVPDSDQEPDEDETQ